MVQMGGYKWWIFIAPALWIVLLFLFLHSTWDQYSWPAPPPPPSHPWKKCHTHSRLITCWWYFPARRPLLLLWIYYNLFMLQWPAQFQPPFPENIPITGVSFFLDVHRFHHQNKAWYQVLIAHQIFVVEWRVPLNALYNIVQENGVRVASCSTSVHSFIYSFIQNSPVEKLLGARYCLWHTQVLLSQDVFGFFYLTNIFLKVC